MTRFSGFISEMSAGCDESDDSLSSQSNDHFDSTVADDMVSMGTTKSLAKPRRTCCSTASRRPTFIHRMGKSSCE
uniref:Uncharacterized protein n=1 Tax=Angiostrongylus cantonensis TaxID=6313 RepID=A0A0K0CYE7_ANGCA